MPGQEWLDIENSLESLAWLDRKHSAPQEVRPLEGEGQTENILTGH